MDFITLNECRLFSDTRTTGLKRTVRVTYHSYAVLYNLTYILRGCLIDNGRTVLGYVLVRSTVKMKNAEISSGAQRSTLY